jgi:hypothetical protein
LNGGRSNLFEAAAIQKIAKSRSDIFVF